MTTREEKARELRKKYYKEWRKKNKEKVKQYMKNYWEKKAKEIEEQKHIGEVDIVE